MATNGFFPRPRPSCLSNEFFVPSQGGDKEMIEFGSRPLVCEMCRRWSHARCGKNGCQHVEDILPSTRFCSKACRRLFAEMESWSNKGDQIFESSTGPIFYSLTTPSDSKAFLSSFAQDAIRYHTSSSPSFNALTPGNSMAAVMSLLSRTFSSKGQSSVSDGFMNEASEFDGGKYALSIKDQTGSLTAALTFSVYSTSLPAQVSLCCVEKNKGSALFSIFEGAMEELGVSSIVMEPQMEDLEWARKLGYKLMHPRDALRLHMSLPVSFINAPIVEKRLDPRK